MIVLLDTSFLVSALKFKIDIYDEISRVVPERHELATLDNVIAELEKLTARKEPNAALAMQLVTHKKVSIYKGKRIQCDDALVEFAKEKGAMICTQDKELKKKAKSQNIRVITIKNKSHLGED